MNLIIFLIASLYVAASASDGGHELCGSGSWQKKYTKLHAEMTKGEIKGKYIVGVPVLAGVADVMLGFVSTFLWALLTDRVFYVLRINDLNHKCNERTMEYAYDYHHVNLSAPAAFTKPYYECMLAPYPEETPCSDQTITLPPHPTPLSLRHLRYINSGLSAVKTVDMTQHDQQGDVLVISTNRGTTHNIFENPHHKAALAEMVTQIPTNMCIYTATVVP